MTDSSNLEEPQASPTGDGIHADDREDPGVLSERKADHIRLTLEDDVEYATTRTLLDDVQLAHRSLPELDVDDIDTSTDFLGKSLRYPLLVSGMTGGTQSASRYNRMMAATAQRWGFAFGVGSQRAMMRDASSLETYTVRDVAPDVLLFGNIGVMQAAESDTDALKRLVDDIGADALCVHLNPGQEIIQDHGDRSFTGALSALERLVNSLQVPIVAKETGCGLSPATIQQLVDCGVQHVDVSGAGGTTWIGVETLRASTTRASVGRALWEWGIPTAASTAWAARAGLETIASGGLRDGLDAARALSLGARLVGMAGPWIKAADEGEDALERLATELTETLRAVMLLTGSRTVGALRTAEKRIGPELRDWLQNPPVSHRPG